MKYKRSLVKNVDLVICWKFECQRIKNLSFFCWCEHVHVYVHVATFIEDANYIKFHSYSLFIFRSILLLSNSKVGNFCQIIMVIFLEVEKKPSLFWILLAPNIDIQDRVLTSHMNCSSVYIMNIEINFKGENDLNSNLNISELS